MGIRHVTVLVCLLSSTAAWAAPAPGIAKPPPRRVSRSVGSPTEGRLVGGAHLSAAPHLRITPVYVPGDARYGLDALVNMIDRGARNVRKQFPDAVMSVGHLSRNGGGSIERHHSHESGRDADIGFYMKNRAGKPYYADQFVVFNTDGTAKHVPGVLFDEARNWAAVASFVRDPDAKLSHIFVASHVRARLLAHAEKAGAPADVRVRAAQLMVEPKGVLPHDDHFHLRIVCPASMSSCVEFPALARKHAPPVRARAVARTVTPHAPPLPRPRTASPTKAHKMGTGNHPRREAQEETESSDVGRLTPEVPGLDSVVTGSPMPANGRPSPSEPLESTDDADGIAK